MFEFFVAQNLSLQLRKEKEITTMRFVNPITQVTLVYYIRYEEIAREAQMSKGNDK